MVVMVVNSNASLLACLLRMHTDNHSVTMWNTTREFKVRLRNDPDDPSRLEFDFGIVGDDDEDEDDLVSRVLELEDDGIWDDGLFVVESYSLKRCEVVSDLSLLDPARNRLNALLRTEVCGCGKYFVKDAVIETVGDGVGDARMGATECVVCELTAPISDPIKRCGVCHEDGPSRHMTRQKCCGQDIHKKCLARCTLSSCPFCRQGTRSVVIIDATP
jgi:hypothetical protein